MARYRVEIASKPNYESVEQYRQRMLSEAPNKQMHNKVVQTDIECTCCSQEAPYNAAAMLKVEEKAPIRNTMGQKHGKIVWICADCFHYGVRPIYVELGSINWNREGNIIKNRAKNTRGHPW